MSNLDDQVARQIANVERSTGRSLAEWIEILRASGITKHGQAVAMLRSEHGLGHGNANLIVHKAREAEAGGGPSDDALVASWTPSSSAGCGRPTTAPEPGPGR